MEKYTEKILYEICDKLQLQASLYKLAEQSYNTITDIIQSDDKFKDISLKMYAQGSFRLKTTVKPLNNDEYDLDFVVEIPENVKMTPQQLYNELYRILSQDGVHNEMLEKKSRCVRIVYANDFHMDIMPGQSVGQGTEIIVPDRELKTWYHHSNPIGYAEWFEKQARTHIINELALCNKFQKNAEPIDNQEITERLEPLRKSVQLIKRYRDIYCGVNKKEPVRSIVICTLMGHISSSYSDTLTIISDFCRYVNSQINMSQGKPFIVKNPVVDEILTEKWIEKIQNYQDFVDMMNALTDDVKELQALRLNVDITKKLKKMFGENITNEAVKKIAERLSAERKAGTLTVASSGLLNTKAIGVAVKTNTFYGG